MNKSFKPKVFIIIYVALVAIVFLSWFITRTSPASKAAEDNVTVTFAPMTASLAVGEQREVDVIVQTSEPTKKISGIDLSFTTSGTIEFTGVSAPTGVGSTDTSLFNQVIHSVNPSNIHMSFVSLKTDEELPNAIMFRISIKGTANGQASILLDTHVSQVVGNVAGKMYGFNPVSTPTYTIGSQTTAPPVSLHILPPAFQLAVGQTQDMSFLITDIPAYKAISGFNVVITYNPSHLEVVQVGEPIDATTNGDADKFTKLHNTVDPVAGTIRLAYISSLPEDQLPRQPKVTFTVKGKEGGSGVIQLSEYEVTGNIEENVYTVNLYPANYTVTGGVTATPFVCVAHDQCPAHQACVNSSCQDVVCDTSNQCMDVYVGDHACVSQPRSNGTACTGGTCQGGTCVPDQPQAGNVIMQLKFRFQGILKRPVREGPMHVKLILAGGGAGSSAHTRTVNLTPDDNGVWSGIAAFDVPPGAGYKVYVKGNKHLQKRICDPAPTETAPGTYRCGEQGRITLQEGDNVFDFSNIVQLSGDLPEQDGIVDAYDLAYMRQNIGSSDPSVVAIADINHDGIVDTQDYSLMIAALSVKYDEEL